MAFPPVAGPLRGSRARAGGPRCGPRDATSQHHSVNLTIWGRSAASRRHHARARRRRGARFIRRERATSNDCARPDGATRRPFRLAARRRRLRVSRFRGLPAERHRAYASGRLGGRLDLTIPRLIVFTVLARLLCPPAQARHILPRDRASTRAGLLLGRSPMCERQSLRHCFLAHWSNNADRDYLTDYPVA